MSRISAVLRTYEKDRSNMSIECVMETFNHSKAMSFVKWNAQELELGDFTVSKLSAVVSLRIRSLADSCVECIDLDTESKLVVTFTFEGIIILKDSKDQLWPFSMSELSDSSELEKTVKSFQDLRLLECLRLSGTVQSFDKSEGFLHISLEIFVNLNIGQYFLKKDSLFPLDKKQMQAMDFVMKHLKRKEHGSTTPKLFECGFENCSFHLPCVNHEQKLARSQFNLKRVYEVIKPLEDYTGALHHSVRLSGFVIPFEIAENIASFLNASEIDELSTLNKNWSTVFRESIPGLSGNIQLYPHQMYSLRKMVEFESRPFTFQHSAEVRYFSIPFADGNVLYLDRMTGLLETKESIELINVYPKGGLYCDEPGLGKSVTMISLILKTNGRMTNCPKGSNSSECEEKSSGHRKQLYDSLKTKSVPLASKTTLLIVPKTLVDHWSNQFHIHTRKNQLSLLVVTRDKSTASRIISQTNWRVCESIPKPDTIVQYNVILTDSTGISHTHRSATVQNLLSVVFQRVVVDEGHSLGNLGRTHFSEICRNLRARSRWIMTGTPTPTTPNSDLSYFYGLLEFLHVSPYDRKSFWRKLIARPFEAYDRVGLENLIRMLKQIMIRHTKSDLEERHELPRCRFKDVELSFSEEERSDYMELVNLLERNLLTTNYSLTSSQSLLHASNRKHAVQAVYNLRMACSIAGKTELKVNPTDLEVVTNLLRETCSTPENIKHVSKLLKTQDSIYFNCDICESKRRLPLVLACGHVSCTKCAQLMRSKALENPQRRIVSADDHHFPIQCPRCKLIFSFDTFVRLQPSYLQLEWKPSWQQKLSSKLGYLLQSLKSISSTEKCIVFTEFDVFAARIAQELQVNQIRFSQCFSGLSQSVAERKDSLAKFRNDEKVSVLILGTIGAVGLDLSFVSRIFLMEPMWDKSTELQVVSRAHRLGAMRDVYVERLLIRDTCEHSLFKQSEESSDSTSDSKKRMERKRVLSLLGEFSDKRMKCE